ncbi:MAG: hypothetical protein HC786_19495 [Richelia sp. CSU_2_1]|nr:hypothetical protein [Richelia sp. CSU_2_1]
MSILEELFDVLEMSDGRVNFLTRSTWQPAGRFPPQRESPYKTPSRVDRSLAETRNCSL